MTKLKPPDLALRRRILAGLLAVALGTALAGAGGAGAQTPARGLRLVVDYGDGVAKTIDGLSWSSGETVLDAMNEASRHPHGIAFKVTGRGANAILTEIDGQAGEGNGGNARNWQYWVNADFADKSLGIYTLAPGDTVTWRFAKYQGN